MPKKIPDEDFPGFAKNKTASSTPALGKKVSNFKASSTAGAPFELKNFKGKKVVLYFYPKDHTSGCTTQGIDFSKDIKKFKKENVEIFGISRESLDSHKKFIEKQDFKFDLLSDPDEVLCKHFDVIKEKSMYGRKYFGIERSTFFLDEDLKLVKEWRKVKVPGHIEDVFNAVKELS